MLTSDYDFTLPPELIAQHPPATRGTSRMMVLRRDTGRVEHRLISDITDYLEPNDLLVLNDTRVLPARLKGVWEDTNGGVEFLLIEKMEGARPRAPQETWLALCGSGRKPHPGLRAKIGGNLFAEILERHESGQFLVRFESDEPLETAFEKHGEMPLPPYIKRPEPCAEDAARYQTIYAREPGAVAAPTAGLHFTDELFSRLQSHGVQRAFVTLHVGIGTFRPVTAERVEDHTMHDEWYNVSPATVASVAACHKAGGRVVAVGSTSVRTLESAVDENGELIAGSGRSDIFIYPPHAFRNVGAILTNFHFPRSTLLMMMSAFAGREHLLAAYHEAVRERYRFYSYGDCMLII